MQTLTEKAYKLAPPDGTFDERVVRNYFTSLSAGARKVLVYRAAKRSRVRR